MKLKNIFTSKTNIFLAASILLLVNAVSATAQYFNKGEEVPNVVNGTTYPFAASTSGVLADMTTGTTQLVAPGVDDTPVSPVTNIGFTFTFDGVNYTQFSASSNGVMALGATQITTNFDNADPTSGFSANLGYPKIAPYWDDLCTGTGSVRYKLFGAAPTRTLVVEWQNVNRYDGSCPGVALGTFQVILFEANGRIDFTYGAVASTIVESYTVGITQASGITATNGFASVTTATNTVSYTAANNANSANIAAGRLYSFGSVITAAGAKVGGRVTNSNGRGIAQTTVTLADSGGVQRKALTNSFGYFVFEDVDAGQTYIVQARNKRYVFPTQVITVTDDLSELEITGTEAF